MADAKKSRIGLYIIVGLAIVLAATAVWYFFLRGGADCDPQKPGYDKKGNYTDKCKAVPPAANETTSTGSKWIPESFPLKKGMWGDKIKIMQQKLNIDDDGKFWTGTEAAVAKALGGKTEVSPEDYAKITNPATTAGAQNFQQLKDTLKGASQNFKDGILYVVPGQNKNYQFDFYADNGRFFVSEKGKNAVLKKGTYYDGGRTMKIDNGPEYHLSPIQNMQNIVNFIEE